MSQIMYKFNVFLKEIRIIFENYFFRCFFMFVLWKTKLKKIYEDF